MTTVMIADDDRVWVELLGTALRKHGLQVVAAYDAMQTTMTAMRHMPSLIVLDVQMPGGSGLDALTRLKMSTKTSMIPVVVVSGMTDAGLPKVVAEMGAASFVRKPTTADAVREVVCGLLGTS